jgi:hypothetical protein
LSYIILKEGRVPYLSKTVISVRFVEPVPSYTEQSVFLTSDNANTLEIIQQKFAAVLSYRLSILVRYTYAHSYEVTIENPR